MVLVDAKTKSGDALDAMLREILPDTRAFDGCEGLTIHRNEDDPTNVVFVETWESRPQYDKYLAWRQENGSLQKLVELFSEPPSIRYYSTVGV